MTAARRPVLAEQLDLQPHREGGWYRRTWTSSQQFQPAGYDGLRATASGIYFLLEPGESSQWHVVASDELWLWHRGGPLTLMLGGDGPQPIEPATTLILGPDIEAGQQPQIAVPAGSWQAAAPAADQAVLVTCIVSPEFSFADFRMVEQEQRRLSLAPAP